ncbi:phenylalanine--tRNA ligase subunit beta [Lachnospiraceae bacterium MD329]|nr:phenylalanine--tRNA ligase subunit beta [Lachnospiraceae bacterium MD329]
MNLPMSWLNDYMDINVTPKEYSDRMTMSGSKVEGFENMGENVQNVVAGKVLTCEDHPDSDHLHVCTVDAGTGEILQIVCGAPNVKAGIIVPTALVGATLPDGKIKKGKLRGVESFGMLCSHDELGITEDMLGYEPEYGILILPDDTPVGKDIRDIFGMNETVVEFEITSNRPDCFSIIGLARETAATFDKKFTIPEVKFTEDDENIADTISVDVLDKDKCQRYCARMVKNVKIGPSPSWMQERLRACGVRPINNIVDITNYVLLEYGQPMHAFDLRDLEDNKIIVRRAENGEVIKTLDEQDRTLTNDDLVIADGKKAVAIAGVMGGFNSEVKDDTTTVIFESATFEASSVRLTAQRVGLRTEASSRYEKGLDYNNTVPAVERACQLVEELGCGENTSGMIDVMGNVTDMKTLPFRPEKINAFLGTNISTEQMVKYFDALEIKTDLDKMTVTPPSFRPDLEGEADIAEEVARFYGYDKIPVTLLSGEATCGKKTDRQAAQDDINKILTALGMYEIYTYTFTSPSVFDKLSVPADSKLRNAVKISNPLGEDTSIMRTTTIASMLDILSRNYNYRNAAARLFEIGKIFTPTEEGKLPDEPLKITIGIYGDKADFYDIKGICEEMFRSLNVQNVKYEAVTDNPTFHPGRCAKISAGGKTLGIIGEIHPAVGRKYGIETPVYIGELDFENVFLNIGTDVKFKELPKYPAVTRDIAMLVDKTVPVADIEEVVKKASGKLLESINLFDVYEGEQIPEGKKSVAYSAVYRALDRSLTGDEVQKVFDKVLKNLENQLGAQLR